LLIERGLLRQNAAKRFSVTAGGVVALGEAMPAKPQPWLRMEMVSAALSKDVLRRLEHPNEMSSVEKSRHSAAAARKARSNAKRNRSTPFNAWFDMAS
jgi:hypothetical protein